LHQQNTGSNITNIGNKGGYIQNLTQSIQERRMTTEGVLLRVAAYAYKQDMIRIGYSCIRNKEKTVRKGYNRVAS